MEEPQRVEGCRQTMWIEDGILRIVVHPGRHGREEAEENVRHIAELLQGRPLPRLIDVRRGTGLSRDARSIYGDPQRGPRMPAVAFLVESPLSRVLGNFFLGLASSGYPQRLFTDEGEALRWLRPYRG